MIPMPTMLEQAIQKMRELPPDRQERFAQFLLQELASDADWERSTAVHAVGAQRLVEEVLAADDRGETEPLDLERL
jgi:hypothetical protein